MAIDASDATDVLAGTAVADVADVRSGASSIVITAIAFPDTSTYSRARADRAAVVTSRIASASRN